MVKSFLIFYSQIFKIHCSVITQSDHNCCMSTVMKSYRSLCISRIQQMNTVSTGYTVWGTIPQLKRNKSCMKNCALVITLNWKPTCLLTDQVTRKQQQLNEQIILLHSTQDSHSCKHQYFRLLGPIQCILVDIYYHFDGICCHRFQGRSVRHTWNNCTHIGQPGLGHVSHSVQTTDHEKGCFEILDIK